MGGLVKGDGWLSQGRWVAKKGRWVAKLGRWVAKLIARLLATAALWVPIQISLKNTKWPT